MKYLFDMVHHNPSEPPFVTKYNDSAFLKQLGYNGQVYKNINLTATYNRSCPGLIDRERQVSKWIDQVRHDFDSKINHREDANFKFYSHIDPFIIPSIISDAYKSEMFDEEGISIYRDRTQEIMKDMLEEIFTRYPGLEGLIIRTGETYLFDSPHHTGNNPIHYFQNKDHTFEEGDISIQYRNRNEDLIREKEDLVYLINFLKEIVCIHHGKKLIFRTWDVFDDRFHADADYYLDVTDRIEPHELLIFSLKHTRLDFLRYVESNPAIGLGKHKQIIEVQFQREYEGKGAFPNYFANHLIEGFPETEGRTGFRDYLQSPLVEGVYGWSRGGGWYGPYIKNEFWIDLNLQVFLRWIKNPYMDEEELFHTYLTELGFNKSSREAIRQIALLSSQALLKGRYCSYGKLDKLWMRDDVIGGLNQLSEGFDCLRKSGMANNAIMEKKECVLIWSEIVRLSLLLTHEDDLLTEFIEISCLYGLHLFSVIEKGWQILIQENVSDAVQIYQQAWEHYQNLTKQSSQCPTLYRGQYWNWPGEGLTPGMEDSILS
ncbi:MAG: hypothetical protein PF450_00080 [Bacteroidales bacterium]|jgi:hypothetical protein|nr:hypothetical protein [Bacteroidales bacterium]